MSNRNTYWVTVNDRIVANGMSYYKACKMFHKFRLSDDNLILCVEMGNDLNGNCINSVSF